MTIHQSFNNLFEAYENMRDRSEIEEEVAKITWARLDGAELDLSQNDTIEDMPEITELYYYKGYVDALKWVVGGDD